MTLGRQEFFWISNTHLQAFHGHVKVVLLTCCIARMKHAQNLCQAFPNAYMEKATLTDMLFFKQQSKSWNLSILQWINWYFSKKNTFVNIVLLDGVGGSWMLLLYHFPFGMCFATAANIYFVSPWFVSSYCRGFNFQNYNWLMLHNRSSWKLNGHAAHMFSVHCKC